jgi:hypothetical protein
MMIIIRPDEVADKVKICFISKSARELHVLLQISFSSRHWTPNQGFNSFSIHVSVYLRFKILESLIPE